ncbi:MAG: ABC transporter substrate-binding protein [Acetobacteraceae bacterium]
MQRRTLLATAAASALARPALAAGPSRVLRFVPQSNLSSPDPIWTTADVTRNHAYLIYDTLYGVDTNLVASPQMCGGHEVSPDKLTWRFTLRDGLAFHDGAPVRAIDCTTSITRWGKRDGFGQILAARLAAMTVLDDKRFELRTKTPFPVMLHALGANSCFIMPERIAKTDAFKQIDDFTGSGPFRFVRDEWVSGSRAVYARNEAYVPAAGTPDYCAGGKVVHLDRVEWLIMPDAATAAVALQNAEVDWIEQPLIDLVPLLQRNRDITVRKFDPFGVIGVVVFNHLHPPFDNPKLRRALLPALDQTAYLSAVIGDQPDFKRAGVGVFTPGTPLANTEGLDVLTGPRDLAQTRALVAESGYKGEKVVLLCPTDYPTLQAVATMTRELFVGAGLNVEFVTTDWGTLVARRASQEPVEKGGWSTFCTSSQGAALSNPIANNMIRGAGRAGWFGWPDSPALRDLRNAWLDAPDPAAQKAIAGDIQRTVLTEVPYIPTGQWFTPSAWRNTLAGIVSSSSPMFWNVTKA